MLNYHDINDIEGKVSKLIVEDYKKDYGNLAISSIIAGFHRTYGLLDEGLSMSLEIVENIGDDTDNIYERNILVWNLYKLTEEFINDRNFDVAMKMAERAEKNWSRDVLMGDDIGVYHISWLEQIFHKKAEIYLMLDDRKNFEMTTDLILERRMNFFNEVERVTGETISGDRCVYNCFKLMAIESKGYDIKKAIMFLKQGIIHKAGYKLFNSFENVKNKKRIRNSFDIYMKYFQRLPDHPYDSVRYGYCGSCEFFMENSKCVKRKCITEENKACSDWKA